MNTLCFVSCWSLLCFWAQVLLTIFITLDHLVVPKWWSTYPFYFSIKSLMKRVHGDSRETCEGLEWGIGPKSLRTSGFRVLHKLLLFSLHFIWIVQTCWVFLLMFPWVSSSGMQTRLISDEGLCLWNFLHLAAHQAQVWQAPGHKTRYICLYRPLNKPHGSPTVK